MTTSITAAVATAFGAPLQLEELTLRAPISGEVQVRIEAVAICHSDISYLEGGWGGPLPAVYGHEAAGVIVATGPGTPFASGQRVIVTLMQSCGACACCGTGQQVYCSDYTPTAPVLSRADGSAVAQGLNCGAFGEQVVVHHSQVVARPESIHADVGALLACGVPTGLGAVINTAQVRPGDKVVVIGAGGVGLNAIQGAQLSGAARIVAVDLAPEKLADATAFGATDVVLATEPKPWKQAQAAMAGQKADHVFVTVGAIPAYDTATKYLKPRGQVTAVGMPHGGQTASYAPDIISATGQGIQGSFMGETVLSRDIPYMIDLYQQGRLQLDPLISGRWRLDQINAAIDDTRGGKARRNVIVM